MGGYLKGLRYSILRVILAKCDQCFTIAGSSLWIKPFQFQEKVPQTDRTFKEVIYLKIVRFLRREKFMKTKVKRIEHSDGIFSFFFFVQILEQHVVVHKGSIPHSAAGTPSPSYFLQAYP